MARRHFDPEIAARAFSLRRFDLLTCREVAALTGVQPNEVEPMVRQHEQAHGALVAQRPCGQPRAVQERIDRAVALFMAGALPSEIREIVGYRQSANDVSTTISQALNGTVIRHGRISVTSASSTVPIINVYPRALELCGWKAGAAVRWKATRHEIVLKRALVSTAVEASPEEEMDTWLAPAPVPTVLPGLTAEQTARYADAYHAYRSNEKLARIARRHGVSSQTILHRAEKYARLAGLPWCLRQAHNATEGVLHVSTEGVVALGRATRVTRWPIGTDVLWRQSRGPTLTLTKFDLNELVGS